MQFRDINSIFPDSKQLNTLKSCEDILRDIQEVASRYGVAILGADVKDLVFPGICKRL